MEYAVGIDLGGTSVKYALVSKAGDSFFEGELPSLASLSAEKVKEQLLCATTTVLNEACSEGLPVKGIGIGTPGIVDETRRIILGGAENIVGWENVDIASYLERNTSLPVIVGNDANLMGLGETMFGAGKGKTHVVFLTIGTGIGGAVIIDGKLFGGYANRGMELGHIPLIADGERCACGAVGCWEHYASTSALVRRFAAKVAEKGVCMDRPVDGHLIVQLYREGDDLAVDCMNRHFYYLGRGIAGLINIFSPQLVVVGGGISRSGSFYLEEVRQVVAQNVMADCAVNTKIVSAELGNHAGFIGAASLILT